MSGLFGENNATSNPQHAPCTTAMSFHFLLPRHVILSIFILPCLRICCSLCLEFLLYHIHLLKYYSFRIRLNICETFLPSPDKLISSFVQSPYLPHISIIMLITFYYNYLFIFIYPLLDYNHLMARDHVFLMLYLYI